MSGALLMNFDPLNFRGDDKQAKFGTSEWFYQYTDPLDLMGRGNKKSQEEMEQRLREQIEKGPDLNSPEAITAAQYSAAARRRQAAGADAARDSTILTGPLGLTSEANTQRKTLLGT